VARVREEITASRVAASMFVAVKVRKEFEGERKGEVSRNNFATFASRSQPIFAQISSDENQSTVVMSKRDPMVRKAVFAFFGQALSGFAARWFTPRNVSE